MRCLQGREREKQWIGGWYSEPVYIRRQVEGPAVPEVTGAGSHRDLGPLHRRCRYLRPEFNDSQDGPLPELRVIKHHINTAYTVTSVGDTGVRGRTTGLTTLAQRNQCL